jgi:hypothetical protein
MRMREHKIRLIDDGPRLPVPENHNCDITSVVILLSKSLRNRPQNEACRSRQNERRSSELQRVRVKSIFLE